MQISFSSGTFYHRGVGYSLRQARELGYDGVELALGWDFMRGGVPAVERALSREGGTILSVHPPFLPLPGWPRTVHTRLERMVTASRELGAGVLVLHTPFLWGEDSPRARSYTRLLAWARSLAGDDVRICLENGEHRNRRQRYLLDDLATLARFAEERGCGITYDTCHVGANGEDVLKGYEIVRPVLANIHLSDLTWGKDGIETHVVPGRGTLPLRELLAVLAADHYDGLITFEIHPRQVGLFGRERHRRILAEALAYVRDALGASAPAPVAATATEGGRISA
jgi:sugar phosphate isomerase/epimerase